MRKSEWERVARNEPLLKIDQLAQAFAEDLKRGIEEGFRKVKDEASERASKAPEKGGSEE